MGYLTDQKRIVATEEDCKAPWGGIKYGKRFRCYLCGHKFKPGDKFRWVFAASKGLSNFLTCESCDGADVLERWAKQSEEAKQRFWWLSAG